MGWICTFHRLLTSSFALFSPRLRLLHEDAEQPADHFCVVVFVLFAMHFAINVSLKALAGCTESGLPDS